MKARFDTKSSIGLIIVLWVAGLGAATQFAKFSVTFSFLHELYPERDSELGLLVSLIGFLGIGLGLFAGLIVTHFGFRRLLVLALALGALMSFYQATLPPFELMLFSRLIEGASHLIIVVAAPTLIAQTSSQRHRGLAMTLWSTFFGVAFALVAWFGIPLVNAYGLQGLFFTHAIVLSLTAAILALWLPAQAPTTGGLHLNFTEIVRAHMRTYKSPFVSAPAIGWLFYTLTFVSLLTILPGLVPDQNRIFVAGAMPIASIVISMVCGAIILPRLSPISTIILGFILAISTLLYLLITPDKTWACIALLGVLGLVQAASFAAIPQLNKSNEAQSRANGAMAQMGNLGNTLGTPILLSLLAAFGLSGMVWGVIAIYGAAIGTHIFLKNRRTTTMQES